MRPFVLLRGAGWLAPAVVTLLGCQTGGMGPDPERGRNPAWPPEDPRVRFDRALVTERDVSGSGFFSRLAGKQPQPLFERPFGVAWDGDDLVVTDPGAGRIVLLEQAGKIRRSSPGLLSGPIGVDVCTAGIVVADARSGRVGLLDDQLRLIRWLAEDLQRPTGVACIPEGVAVVETGAHRVVILSEDGSLRSIGHRGSAPGEFNFPTAITFDGDSLWVGDTLNFRIQTIDLQTGAAEERFGHIGDAPGENPRIKGIAVDTLDRVWVSDALLDVVALFDTSGNYLMRIGNRGSQDGQFSFPTGIAIHPDGRVAVVDSLNRRIQILRITKREDASRETR
ncbi:MAG: hypothetical protein ACC742_06365 [Thermoanaerobaculales bacterium]